MAKSTASQKKVTSVSPCLVMSSIVITPQGGSQNIIFVASGYLTQRELYRLGALITLAFLAVYLVIGSPWVYFVMR